MKQKPGDGRQAYTICRFRLFFKQLSGCGKGGLPFMIALFLRYLNKPYQFPLSHGG